MLKALDVSKQVTTRTCLSLAKLLMHSSSTSLLAILNLKCVDVLGPSPSTVHPHVTLASIFLRSHLISCLFLVAYFPISRFAVLHSQHTWLMTIITVQGVSEAGVASSLQTQCVLRRGLSPGSFAWPTRSLFSVGLPVRGLTSIIKQCVFHDAKLAVQTSVQTTVHK